MSRSRKPLLAALFAFVYPGLGHLYLRTWLRAAAWFGLSVVTAMLVLPESVFAAVETEGISAALEATRTLPLDVYLPLLFVRGLNVVDAYVTGRRRVREGDAAAGDGAGVCPECGEELDGDLDFCPWCTARLSEDEDAEGENGVTSR